MLMRALPLLVVVTALGCWHVLLAEEPTFDREIGNEKYRLRVVFEDDFENLDRWLIESTGKVSTENNQLVWDCFSSGKQAGTIWCKHRFSGPTVVEFNAVAEAGARDLNFILYAIQGNGD